MALHLGRFHHAPRRTSKHDQPYVTQRRWSVCHKLCESVRQILNFTLRLARLDALRLVLACSQPSSGVTTQATAWLEVPSAEPPGSVDSASVAASARELNLVAWPKHGACVSCMISQCWSPIPFTSAGWLHADHIQTSQLQSLSQPCCLLTMSDIKISSYGFWVLSLCRK